MRGAIPRSLLAKGLLEARAVNLLARHTLAADRALLVELVVAALRRRSLAAEVFGNGGRDAGVVNVVSSRVRLGDETRLVENAKLVDAVETVLDGVVGDAAEREIVSRLKSRLQDERDLDALTLQDDALKPAEMVRVNGNTVVMLGFAGANVAPVTVDLAEVHAGRVGQEEEAAEDSEGAEGEREPELGAVVDVAEDNGGDEGADLAACRGKAVWRINIRPSASHPANSRTESTYGQSNG